ncbi:PolC-type DNA polymerase III [Tissierella sp.]|uniref:PolC-type DNA polymerase III n=1 Tax=Tissierella sp. TaxID=41274 RepID=UPI002858EB98|nr:PolC-type DNA polymerase III [Tissierella sp.]MDR7856231.1 PolC-type DNA polymerase III [Tissierella sp.]
MNTNQLYLSQLITSEEDNDIKSLEILIKKVEIMKDTMELIIYLESISLINEEMIIRINNLFSDYFNEFKILVKFKYNVSGSYEEKLIFYKDSLLEFIESQIQSSKSWIEDMKWEIKDKSLIIIPPNQIAYYSMTKNGLEDRIKDKVYEELGINIEITVSDSGFLINNDYLNLKDLEEKEIAVKTLNSIETKTKTTNTNKSSKYYMYGKQIKDSPIKVNEINMQTGTCTVEGQIFQLETRQIKNNKTLVTFYISDLSDSITVKVFLSEEQSAEFLTNVIDDTYVKITGDVTYDSYSRTTVIMLKSLNKVDKEVRKDNSIEKRVELHLHTKMSSMDGVTSLKKLATRAKEWGHKALAITDHGVVQGFPEAMELSKSLGIKMIYGMEGYLVNDKKQIVTNFNENVDYSTYVVFDIETTGLSAINDMITEIGAVRIKDGKVIDVYSQLINPNRPIPTKITELTGITDEMVRDKPSIHEVILDFKEFIKDDVLVAHNASFDVGFIRQNMKLNNLELDNPVLDTLELSRAVFPELKNHKLNNIAKHLNVSLVNHHRAVDDATATAEILIKILNMLCENNISSFKQINTLNQSKDLSKDVSYHIVILAKNLIGLKNLYKLVSESHVNYFHRRPRIPKSMISANREGLIIGSACESGELYRAILNSKSSNEINEIVRFYDFLEIQPLQNNAFLIRDGKLKDEEQLKSINKRIYNLGKSNNKLVVATGDVHFLDPEDEVYRRMLMSGQKFQDADLQPPLYFKSTDEMLDEFSYLGQDIAREVVVDNTNLISDSIDEIIPIPEGTFPPVIEGAEEELKKITYEKAIQVYGNPLPDIVEKRLERELTSIIKNGYAVMYIIAQKLVWKSLEDGYLVGSRGSVGSSFVATMSGITEVNPLEPHYVCPACKYSEFFDDGSIASGVDLPNKECPKCNTTMIKDGHNIPFEVFLGFEGDKEPDIDLNFAGEYQSVAHKYTEELFGEGYVFRAGTIGTIADKTAYGFVKKYFEERDLSVSAAEINRLVQGCTGIKRTTGQHPGGVMIVPKYKEILDFTPIQYPANDKKSGVLTTHFDYNAISGRILKLDILGHDVPTIIRMLFDLTGVDPTSIPLDEPKTMKLFTSTESLGITKEDINCPVGTLGIPEFGTKFVRQMLMDTMPSTFSELVRISGLSHGTDVWINNAQELVKNDIAPLSKVISTREDIMLFLINAGLDKKKSFKIMENVRKGKGLSKEDEEAMEELGVPQWYIDSCNKIKYMFPKAHAAAYVMMSFRIAYFKVYYPEAFYSTYFTIKANDFDADLIIKGSEFVKNKIEELEKNFNDITAKEKNLLTVLEVVLEMFARGYKIQKVDLYRSDSDKFIIDDNGILPPLKSLEGLGENVARKIVEERNMSRFISREDLVNRGKVSKPVLEVLTNHGCLGDLPLNNQISLFNI